jgi:hypothetical protein
LQDTPEILASLTLVTDIFTISGESSGIVANRRTIEFETPGMTARRVLPHDRVDAAPGGCGAMTTPSSPGAR